DAEREAAIRRAESWWWKKKSPGADAGAIVADLTSENPNTRWKAMRAARGYAGAREVVEALVAALEREKAAWVAKEGWASLAKRSGSDFGWREDASPADREKAIAAAKAWLGTRR